MACRTNQVDRGLGLLADAVKRAPDNTGFRFSLASTLQEAGRLAEASLAYRECLALNPNYVEAIFNLGINFQQIKDLEGAEALF